MAIGTRVVVCPEPSCDPPADGSDGRRASRSATTPHRPARVRHGVVGQTNVLQFANWVLGLSPMNSVADQIWPVGSANEAL